MRVAVIGSRDLIVDIEKYIPEGTDEIVTGGAVGIDQLAERYADEYSIPKLIIKPEYAKYGRRAPLERNKTIVEAADFIVAVWNGHSTGTKHAINYAKKLGKEIEIYIIE